MKKFFFLTFIFLSLHGFSQWNQLGLTTTSNLYNIKSFGNSLYVGGVDTLFISYDDGATWTAKQIVSSTGVSLVVSRLTGLEVLDANTIIGTGLIAAGNSETILKSTNGGDYWGIVSLMNSGTWPRKMNDLSFFSYTNGYACGTQGRILYTTNSGNTWTWQSTSSSSNITNIQAINTTKAFAAGGFIYKTINSGTNWTVTPYSGLQFISMTSNGFGFATTPTNIYKTINDGTSWSLLSKTFTSITSLYTLNKDTIFIGADDELYISRNAGLLWEKFPNLSGNTINKIYFKDINNGYFVTDEGKVFKTTNIGGNSLPSSSFTTSTTNFCVGFPVTFTNTGSTSYTYQWLINGNLISTTNNLTYTFLQGNQTDTVSLVAYNGFLYDTCTQILNIQPELDVADFTISVASDTVCNNTGTIVTVYNSQVGATYKLTKNGNLIGNYRAGTGDTLNFPTGNITSTSTFVITGFKSNSCGIQQITHNVMVCVVVFNLSLPISVLNPIVCNGDTTFIKIANSQFGVNYLLGDNVVGYVGTPIEGNGDTLILPTASITSNRIYRIYTSYHNGCSGTGQFYATLTIIVQNLNMSFESSAGGCIGDSIHFTNTSTADTYYWIFDNSASILSDTSTNSVVAYNSIGEKTITLIGNTIMGCSDTVHSSIYIYLHSSNSNNGSYCFFDTISQVSYPYYWPGHILDYHVDNSKNSYVAGCYHHTYGVDGKECMFLRKFDPNGNLLWEEVQSPFDYTSGYSYYKSSFITGVTTDDEMNVYITGSYASYQFKMDTITIDHSDLYIQFFIAKLDSNGSTQWIIHSNTLNLKPIGGTDILFVNNNQIYVSILNHRDHGIFADGSSHTLGNGDATILEIDCNGHYKNNFPVGPYNYNYDYFNLGYLNPNNSSYNEAKVATVSPKLELSQNGKIYVFGKFRDYLNFGSIQISEIITDPAANPANGYVAILDTIIGWENAYALSSSSTGLGVFPVYTLDCNNNIYITETMSANNYIQLNNGDTIYSEQNNNSIIAKYDPNGNLLWHNMNYGIYIASIESYNPTELIIYGEFNDFTGFFCQNIDEVGVPSNGGKDLAIASITVNGDVNWVDNIGSIGTDDALFMRKKCGNLFIIGNLQDTTITNYDTLNYNGDNLFLLNFSPIGNCDSICNPLTLIEPAFLNEKIQDIKVFPNPTGNNINIRFNKIDNKPIQMEIYNTLGIQVYQSNKTNNQYLEQIKVSELPKGLYYLIVKSSSNNEAIKFIKE